VLTAFQNVADALRALEYDATTLKAQAEVESLARESLTLSTSQYRLGALSYLALLDAQRTYQQARINLVSARAARFADTAALFQALGGGWWNRGPLPQVPLALHSSNP
jgi:outer membrane protein TolC